MAAGREAVSLRVAAMACRRRGVLSKNLPADGDLWTAHRPGRRRGVVGAAAPLTKDW